MKFNVSKLPDRLANGLSVLSDYFDFEIADKGVKLLAEQGDELDVSFDGKRAVITYPTEPAFYRAVGHMLQSNDSFQKHECSRFDMCGAMYDHSRNGVLNIEYTKKFIADLAMLGMNTYLMYMEDVYQIADEPLFGYMLGAYTHDQLKEIDDFAYELGIEVIPCIQTLAHLNKFLNFDSTRQKYADIDDILEVGKPEVCDLIDRMFAAMKKCFRTTRLHAGMDEAYFVGRGKYLDNNGYQPRKQVMTRQIELVSELAKKYDYEIIMWDDMFYRGEGSELTGNRPDNIHLVYWNYYDENVSTYLEKLDIRLNDDPDTYFAGGAWRWGGAVPCHRKTIVTTEAALAACVERNVRNVFTTLWGDDGSETPVEAGLLGTVMFAEYNYNLKYSRDDFKAKLQWISGMSYDEWMLQDDINNFAPVCGHDNCFDKYALYQDPMCGIHDRYIQYAAEQADLTLHYKQLAVQFDLLAKRNDKNADVNKYYAALCRTLELKWNLGLRLCDAYKAKDKAELIKIVNNAVVPLMERIDQLRQCRLDVWLKENKIEGFEILDNRYGALIARMKTMRTLINRYVVGDIEAIEPLAAERYLHTDEPEILRMCFYSKIVSAGCSW